MKISKRDEKLLLYAGGVLLAVLAYLLAFRNLSEKNAAIKSENLKLSEQVQQLEVLDANKEQYYADAKEMNQKVDEIINQYPSEIRSETAVMYAYEMEQEASIHFSAMTIDTKNLLYTTGENQSETDSTAADGTTDTEGTDSAAGTDASVDTNAAIAGQPSYYLWVCTLNLDYTVTYQGFKDVVDFIQSDLDKRNVESLSLSYDSDTGNLIGTMVVNLFELHGVDKEYVAPYIPSMSKGNTNPFGSTEVLQDSQGTEGEQEAQEEQED